MNLPLIFLIIVAVVLAYSLRFFRLVKSKGLDPALITYANPISIKGYWGFRAGLASGLVLSFWNMDLAEIILTIVLVSAICHLLILLAFGRYYTQPFIYYLLITTACSVIFISEKFVAKISLVLIIILAEMYLRFWLKTNQSRYNLWVCKTAKKINRRYKYLSSDMTGRNWFAVLHIATTEYIARPKIVRVAEVVYYWLKKPPVISTGIMQVRSDTPLSDKRSMELGSGLVIKAMEQIPVHLNQHDQIRQLAKQYNGSFSYANYLELTYPGVKHAWREINSQE